MQNGLLKDDVLGAAFGAARVVGAVTIFSAEREDDGTVTVSGRDMTYPGELGGGTSARAHRAAALLTGAGIPAEADADIQSVLWSKLCNAAGVFGVSVLTRVSAPAFLRNPDLLRAYLSLVRETAAVATASGVQIGDYPGFPVRSYTALSEEETRAAFLAHQPDLPSRPQEPEGTPSMTQDLLAGRWRLISSSPILWRGPRRRASPCHASNSCAI